jgi:hypothetical protein
LPRSFVTPSSTRVAPDPARSRQRDLRSEQLKFDIHRRLSWIEQGESGSLRARLPVFSK